MATQAFFNCPTTVDSKDSVNELNDSVTPEKSVVHKAKDIITKNEAILLTHRSLSADAQLINYQLSPYSEEKIGFLGSHQKLTLKAKTSECSDPIERCFFVKTIPYDSPIQVAYINEKGAFPKEVEFFQKLWPLLLENYKGEAWAPKCHLVKEDTLVFEDMKPEGFTNRPRFLDEECVMSASACIARFHACSLLAEERMEGVPLNELYPTIFEESEFKYQNGSNRWFDSAINLIISLADDLGLDSSNVRKASNRVFDLAVPSKTKRNVASHADVWSSNLIFDEVNRCRLVDFQLMRYAPPAHDILQLLYLCTPRKFREEHEMKVLQHYYEILKRTLMVNGFDGIVPSFEEILQGVDEQRFPVLVIAALNYPTIMMDGKIGAEVLEKPSAYEEYFFQSRKPYVDRIMAVDPVYRERMRDIVREFIEITLKMYSLPKLT